MTYPLLVGFGGFFGCIARYYAGTMVSSAQPNSLFPWGTFFVNILGCALIGLVFGLSERIAHGLTLEIRLVAVTGFLGGFTTFSAFSIESLSLLRQGEWKLAFSYVLSSVLLGLLATWLGLWVCRPPAT